MTLVLLRPCHAFYHYLWLFVLINHVLKNWLARCWVTCVSIHLSTYQLPADSQPITAVLVLGMCFVAGGTRFSEQGFGMSSCLHVSLLLPKMLIPLPGAPQLNSSLLTLSVIAVLLPAAFHSAVQPSSDGVDPLTNAQEGRDILAISHGVSYFFFNCITADTYSITRRDPKMTLCPW